VSAYVGATGGDRTRHAPAFRPCKRSYDYSGMVVYDVISGTPRWQVFYW
jgi:hypothetical protein